MIHGITPNHKSLMEYKHALLGSINWPDYIQTPLLTGTLFAKGPKPMQWKLQAILLQKKLQAIYPPTRLKLWIIGCVNNGSEAMVSSCAPTMYTPVLQTRDTARYMSTAYQGPVNVLRRQILFAVGSTCRLILSRTCRKPETIEKLLCSSKQDGAEL